jgi:hypothetical protein
MSDEDDGNNGKRPATFGGTIGRLESALNTLKKQNVKTPAAVQIRDEVSTVISETIEAIKELGYTFADNATETLKTLTEQIKELNALRLPAIEQEIRETKVVTKGLPSAENWAPITSKPSENTEATSLKIKARTKQREIKDELRKKREPCQVILTTPNEETKATLSTMHAEKISQRCQNIIDKFATSDDGTTAKPKLKGIARITNGIRLDCHSPEEAQRLRQIDWNNAFKELAVHKPKHSIVIHGVHKAYATGIEEVDVQAVVIKQWGEANNINIHSVKPLCRKPRKDDNGRTPQYCSVVVFTENAHAADKCILSGFYIESEHHAADKCILSGFYIESEHHAAEKYAPQLHITQCFNCYEYGHRSANCKRKKKCGTCASENHSTTECTSSDPHCCGCKGSHPAWSQHCPLRHAEGQRLENLRMETSPFFTS